MSNQNDNRQDAAASDTKRIVIGRTLMEGMDFLSIKSTGNSKYGTISIEFYHPDSDLSDEDELCIYIVNSEMEKKGDYMPLSLNKVEVGKLIDFLTCCKEAL